ncbi:MAG: cysteine hydrolase [Terriglobales bacterium]
MGRDKAKEVSRLRGVNRREVLGLIGATAAASLVGGASEQSALAEQMAAPIQSAKGRTINVDATPQSFAMDTARSAVIVVDMQNDFGTKGGMFDRAGIDISMIQSVVPAVARVLASARHAGVKIVYLKMGFRPDLSDLGAADSPNRERHVRLGVGKTVRAPNGTESRILIRDTWNTEIIPDLTPQADDIILYKHRFSGFYQTELDAILKKLDVTRLLITGCTTSVCVESTVRDAMFRDYRCLLLRDCMAEPMGYGLPRSNHEASLLVMQTLFAWVSDSGEFIKALDAQVAG